MKKLLTPQAEIIYRLIQRRKSMTASDIGRELNIFPHAVYRQMEILENIGCVKREGKYPVKFIANPVTQAVEIFLAIQKEQFLNNLLVDSNEYSGKNVNNQSGKDLDILFIKDWSDLNRRSNADITKSRKKVNLIVSGLEVPAETILVYKRSIERGVKVKVLVQNSSTSPQDMYDSWQKMGLMVRYCQTIKVRLFIVDDDIIYLVSYNPNNKKEGFGARFRYRPLVSLMNSFFNQQWQQASK